MVKPIFSKPDEEMQRRIDEKVRIEVDSKINKEVDEKVKSILKEREDTDRKERADRLAKAVDAAKILKAEAGSGEKEKAEKAEKEKTDKAEREKNDILCPTCHAGHLHKMEQTGLTVKCVGDKCGKEYVLLDTTADYRCQNCGIPLKKPEDPGSMDGCPYCHGKRAVKFDWGKIRKIDK